MKYIASSSRRALFKSALPASTRYQIPFQRDTTYYNSIPPLYRAGVTVLTFLFDTLSPSGIIDCCCITTFLSFLRRV